METLVSDALINLIVQSPIVGVLAVILLLLRSDLKDCIGNQSQLLDKLLDRDNGK